MDYHDNFVSKRSRSNLSGSYLPTEEESKLSSLAVGHFQSETEKYIEELKSGQNNILVAIRTRPLNSRENGISNFETIRVLDGKVVVLLDPQNQFDNNDVFRQHRNKEKQYAFDFAFDKNTNTETVFENTTKFLIPGVLNGFNSTIFAYGATGAGKTFTMLGGSSNSGIIALTMAELFKEIENNTNKDFTVKISYLEVYNETIRDLLSSEEDALELREDAAKGIIVAGITEVVAKTSYEVMAMLKIGNKNRTMEPTGANVVSSRSHAVLQISVEHKPKNQGITEEMTISKLSLIDLAGSERASNTNNKGQRLIEGANINRSLLALGNCITLLSDKSDKLGKNVHIPYRDSKLTRLLKDSLGGNCRTVMIANVSPSVITFEDTHNTLKYANRAKNIKTSVTRNVLSVEQHVEKYTQIISHLKHENDHLKKLLQGNVSQNFSPPQDLSPLRDRVPNKERDRDSGFSINETLVNDIKQHFNEEMRLKKKILDLELQQDENAAKILLMENEMKIEEDKVVKERYEEYLKINRNLPHQIEELMRDYNLLTGKRSQLNNRIQNERHKDNVTFLVSIFKQNLMIIENMDLQVKEKRVENQVRLKDRQIKYLQSQLGIKDRRSKEVTPLRAYSNTPILPNHNTLNIISDAQPIQNDPQEESLSFLNELNDIGNIIQPANLKVKNQMKQALYLPNVEYSKIGYKAINQPSKSILKPVKSLPYDRYTRNPRHNSVKSLPSSCAPSKYYYKKQEFMIQKTMPFEGGSYEEGKRKKKYAYLPLEEKIRKKILGNNTSMRDINEEEVGKDYLRPRRLSFEKAEGRKSLKSLGDESHISTASSSKNEKKKNILENLNLKKDIEYLPKIIKTRSRKQQSSKMRYEDSPYAIKIHSQKL